MSKVKRSEFATFINVGGSSGLSADYQRVGKGVTSNSVAYNPQTTSETYIDEDSATTNVDSYAPTSSTQQTAYSEDKVFKYIDGLRLVRAVGKDAETDILNVYMYNNGSLASGEYVAEKQTVSIQIDDFGGDGGGSNVINYTINYIGESVIGKATISGGKVTFTADE